MLKSNQKIKRTTIVLSFMLAIGAVSLTALAGLLARPSDSDCLKYEKVPGRILVSFRDETTYEEASKQTKDIGLEPKAYGNSFTPIAFGDIGNNEPGAAKQRLQIYPEIEKVTTFTGDSGVHVHFKFGISVQQVRDIFSQEGIQLTDVNGPSIQQTTFLLLDVPVGQEKAYSRKFVKLNSVVGASQHQKCIEPSKS